MLFQSSSELSPRGAGQCLPALTVSTHEDVIGYVCSDVEVGEAYIASDRGRVASLFFRGLLGRTGSLFAARLTGAPYLHDQPEKRETHHQPGKCNQ